MLGKRPEQRPTAEELIKNKYVMKEMQVLVS